jgi:hypothetical protein
LSNHKPRKDLLSVEAGIEDKTSGFSRLSQEGREQQPVAAEAPSGATAHSFHQIVSIQLSTAAEICMLLGTAI